MTPFMQSAWNWLRQTSTILGLAGVAGIAAALAGHQMGWSTAIPALVMAAVAMILPEQAGVQQAAGKTAADAVAAVQSRGLGGSTLALGADLVTLAGLLHPDAPVVAVATSVTAIPPSAARPATDAGDAPVAKAAILTTLLLAVGLGLPGCATQPGEAPAASGVAVQATQDVGAALASYQAALGLAQVALRTNPGLLAKVNAAAQQAAPFVAAAQSGVALAGSAPSLGALAAELLVEAAPFIQGIPSSAPTVLAN